jgi:hypothetical protein
MNAVDMLRNRVTAVQMQSRTLAESSAGIDWSEPVLPGTSPLGLTFWHLPRTLDWLINTTIRGEAEVVDDPAFAGLPDPDRYGFGTGLSAEQAKSAAEQVDRDTLVAYAEAVHSAADTWMLSLSPDDLDRAVPEFAARQATRPAYDTPAARAEVEHLPALPVGALLMRPATSHLLMHLGELDVLIQQALRARG